MREHTKKKRQSGKTDKKRKHRPKRRPRKALAAAEMKLILETIKTGKRPKRRLSEKVKKVLQIMNE